MKIELKIKTIACAGCENSLINAFKGIEGINRVIPSHKTQTMLIDFDESKINIEKIKEIVRKTGKEAIDE
jgi:copper chaperone CopZ